MNLSLTPMSPGLFPRRALSNQDVCGQGNTKVEQTTRGQPAATLAWMAVPDQMSSRGIDGESARWGRGCDLGTGDADQQ